MNPPGGSGPPRRGLGEAPPPGEASIVNQEAAACSVFCTQCKKRPKHKQNTNKNKSLHTIIRQSCL